jgi:hypothetical protein
MTKASQQLQVLQEKTALLVHPHTRLQGATILKTAAAWVFVCALGLAPMPAFAQHGGGGGGGGAHGGGGGSHGGFGGGGGSAPASSGGGAGHASGGSTPSNSSGGSSNHTSTNSSGGGHWWNPFRSGSASSAAPAKGANGVPAGNIKAESSASGNPPRFAAGNNTWQEPPSASARAAARVNYYGPANVNASRPFVPLSSTTRGSVSSAHGTAMVAAAQHPFRPVHPGYPYYPYFGYYPYYGGLGFGWGGGFGPCDPFWGCYGYGFGYGFGGGVGYFGGLGGFGGGSSYGPGWTDASSEGSANVTSPDNPNSYLVAVPGTGAAAAADSSATTQAATGDSTQQPTYVLLYLKDGSSFAVSDYWLTGGKLHYVTSYGGDNAVDESQVDLQRTVNENAARGVDFNLRPQPATTGDGSTTVLRQNTEPQNPEPQKPEPQKP